MFLFLQHCNRETDLKEKNSIKKDKLKNENSMITKRLLSLSNFQILKSIMQKHVSYVDEIFSVKKSA